MVKNGTGTDTGKPIVVGQPRTRLVLHFAGKQVRVDDFEDPVALRDAVGLNGSYYESDITAVSIEVERDVNPGCEFEDYGPLYSDHGVTVMHDEPDMGDFKRGVQSGRRTLNNDSTAAFLKALGLGKVETRIRLHFTGGNYDVTCDFEDAAALQAELEMARAEIQERRGASMNVQFTAVTIEAMREVPAGKEDVDLGPLYRAHGVEVPVSNDGEGRWFTSKPGRQVGTRTLNVAHTREFLRDIGLDVPDLD